jgi:hypothetical protein
LAQRQGLLLAVNVIARGLCTFGSAFHHVTLATGVWTRISYTFVDGAAQNMMSISLNCYLGATSTPWTGAVYIDDFAVE